MSSPERVLPCTNIPAGGVSRRAALGLLALGVAACGFTPAYGPGGAGTRLQGRVRPRDPKTPDEFAFNARLAERLGPDQTGAYALDYTLSLATTPQAVTPGDVTARLALNGSASYRLTGPAGQVLAEGRVNAFSSYASGGTTVATLSAEGDARGRLAAMLADQVTTRLLAAAAAWP